MLEIVEKTLLAGIGALALTQKKAEEVIDDLKERMNLSEEEGKNLLEKLRNAAKENQEKIEELAQNEVKKPASASALSQQTSSPNSSGKSRNWKTDQITVILIGSGLPLATESH